MSGPRPRRPILRAAGTVALGLAFASSGRSADSTFQLQSPIIAPGSTLSNNEAYSGFGCKGKNISPPLRWNGAPLATKSFALTVYDPDARKGSGWWHWLVYDIPASVTELAQGAGSPGGKLPAQAAQARTDFGSSGYGGPCPPPGDAPHHYVFTVYALKVGKLDIPAGSGAAKIGSLIEANKLASATFTAFYGR
jgi:Raf kinase inhibitor-like YbhB/YbcL family protein